MLFARSSLRPSDSTKRVITDLGLYAEGYRDGFNMNPTLSEVPKQIVFIPFLKGAGLENPYKSAWFWLLTVSVKVICIGKADVYCVCSCIQELYSYI